MWFWSNQGGEIEIRVWSFRETDFCSLNLQGVTYVQFTFCKKAYFSSRASLCCGHLDGRQRNVCSNCTPLPHRRSYARSGVRSFLVSRQEGRRSSCYRYARKG